jgi:hypothetical protein
VRDALSETPSAVCDVAESAFRRKAGRFRGGTMGCPGFSPPCLNTLQQLLYQRAGNDRLSATPKS